MSEPSVEQRENTCAQCRESTDCIWVETPWRKKPDGSVPEEFLCAGCYDHLNIKTGNLVIKGSQYKGEESVESNEITCIL